MTDKSKRDKDDEAVSRAAKRRKDKEAAKGGAAADKDTRKALQALKKLLGG